MQNNQKENINYPMLSEEVHNPVYVVKATTDLLMARVAHSGITIQLKGDTHIVQAQAITHLQEGEKLKLMQCDPFPGDTHATFQTLPGQKAYTRSLLHPLKRPFLLSLFSRCLFFRLFNSDRVGVVRVFFQRNLFIYFVFIFECGTAVVVFFQFKFPFHHLPVYHKKDLCIRLYDLHGLGECRVHIYYKIALTFKDIGRDTLPFLERIVILVSPFAE